MASSKPDQPRKEREHEQDPSAVPPVPARATGEGLIRIRGLTFRRGKRVILDGVDMDIPRGSVVAIMGPSGVGKTTILKLIAGQLQPDAGSVQINGQDLAHLGHRGLYALREDMGFLLQNGALFTDLTVFENVAAPLRAHRKLPEAEIAARVSDRLDAVGLGGTETLMPDALSGGMARRVALARAVVLDPSIVMFDEPMAGLDPIAVSTINTLIRETNDRLGLTSIVVTHDVEQMIRLVDHCFILADGRIAGEGPPAALVDSENPSVAQFMNGKVDGPIPFHYDQASGAAR
ncbi:MAG: ATP-binding cassette domain-containing protein [Pseudomonadota bacterium]